MKIGEPKIGSGLNKKYFKLEKGDNVYRILPPMGDLADDGVWAVYLKIQYGYVGLPGNNGKARMHPFVSPEVKNHKTGMIEVEDPATTRSNQIKQAMAEAKARGDEASVKQLAVLSQTFNLDSKWYVNAMNLQGEIGLLKIPHKAKQQLDAEIVRLGQEGVKPLSVDNGRFFVLQRTGEGRDTQYQVKTYKQKIEVQGLGVVEKDMPHVLTPDVLARLGSEAHKLNKLYDKQRPTSGQVARMVKEGPVAVEEILGRKQDADNGMEEHDATPATVVRTSPVTPLPTPVQTATVTHAASPVAQQTVKLGDLPTTTVVSPAASVATSGSGNQSPEDFLKSIGLG